MLNTFDSSPYRAPILDALPTPRLVVFEDAVLHNIAALRTSLEAIVPGSGFRHLCPHIKTHKSRRVLDLQIAAGITTVKCTLSELDLALAAGVPDVFVAYPLVAHEADRVARLAAAHPRIEIWAQIASLRHADLLDAAARRHGVRLRVFIDLDVGNGRTGILPSALDEFAAAIVARRYAAIEILGLHAYDGHNSSVDPAQRAALSRECMDTAARGVAAMRRAGLRCERVIAGGTPPYEDDLRDLLSRSLGARVEVSPGTWIFHDSKYEGILPGRFRFAALVLASVMDLPRGGERVTLDLGHKRWGIDQGPFDTCSLPGLEYVSVSEEHTVLRRTESAPRLEIGDRILIVPRHVCPTVNLWEHFAFVPSGGQSIEESAVDARNR
jgi:D-serine deaminase-like pyridoxal phosphate-dependent protein